MYAKALGTGMGSHLKLNADGYCGHPQMPLNFWVGQLNRTLVSHCPVISHEESA